MDMEDSYGGMTSGPTKASEERQIIKKVINVDKLADMDEAKREIYMIFLKDPMNTIYEQTLIHDGILIDSREYNIYKVGGE